MSMLGFSRHIAVFFDLNGDYIGKQIISRSFSKAIGMKKKTFEFNKGTYHIKPEKASRIDLTFKTNIAFDNLLYCYYEGNPDPVSFKNMNLSPIMDAREYRKRLTSKLVEDLNNAGRGTMDIPWKWILIGIVGIAVAYYFMNGGSLTGTPSPSAVNETIQNVTTVVTRGRV